MRLGHFGDCKPVGAGVFEIRYHFGSGYRVYFSFAGSKLIILLCGGDKDSQQKDIRTAQNYWQDYKWRNYEGRGQLS
jgi:putative addiction module killer protein